MTLNYKQILTYFSSIAYHHEQINSFGFGDMTQLINDVNTKQEPRYTRMYVVPDGVVFNENHIHYNFNVIISDQINEDLSNQREVMSDTLAIAMDVWTVFWQSYTEASGEFSNIIVGDWDAAVQPFLEKFQTVLGGWTLQIKLSAPFDYNSCNLPIQSGFTFPQDESYSSYEQIILDWEQFADAHEQINSFGYGDITQLIDDNTTKKTPLFPRLYFQPETTTLGTNHMHITWRVIICDIVDDDLSNQQDIWSDTLEIAKDLFAKSYLSDYDVEWNADLVPWFQETPTVLAGWTLTMNVQQKFDYNRCTLPIDTFAIGLTWEDLAKLWKKVNNEWKNV
jgi:hypothetical protein